MAPFKASRGLWWTGCSPEGSLWLVRMHSHLPEEASSPQCSLVAVSGSWTLTTVDSWCFSSWETFGSTLNNTRKQKGNTEGQWSSLLLQMKSVCHKIYSMGSAVVQVWTMLSALRLQYEHCLYLISHFLKSKMHTMYSDHGFPPHLLPDPSHLSTHPTLWLVYLSL